MASTVYPAKVALKALLEAAAWPVSTPTITWGQPTEKEDVTGDGGAELVYMRNADVADAFVTLGATRLDETFVLPVIVDVIKYGDDEQATEQRAWQLRDVIVDLLRDNNTISGTVNRITGFRVRPQNFPLPYTWRTQIVVEAQCVGLEYFT